MCNCNKIYKIEELRKCAGRGKDSEYYIPELDEWMNFRKVEEIMSSLGLVNWVHYFNRYMFGVDDPEYIPTCANPGCNNKVSGFSRIRGHNKFCSLKCRSEASWKDSDIRNRMMSNNIVFSYPKGLIGYIMSNPELYENWRSKTPSCQPGGLHKYLIDHNCENYINFMKCCELRDHGRVYLEELFPISQFLWCLLDQENQVIQLLCPLLYLYLHLLSVLLLLWHEHI